MRGVLKPMPGYSQHYLVGVCIPAAGREFLVDDAAVKAFDAKPLHAAISELKVIDDEKERLRRELEATLRAGLCDQPGKPLLMTEKAYAYAKERLGTALLIEPVGGGGVDAVAQLSEKDAEIAQLKARLAELEQPKAPAAKK